MDTINTKKIGLPPSFRTWGFIIVLLAIATIAGLKLIYNDLDAALGTANKVLLQAIIVDLIIIGLVFITMARNKVENEKLFYLKISAAVGAFGFGVMLVLLRTVIDTFDVVAKTFSAGELLLSVLLFYQFTLFITKKQLDKKAD